jgi:hypothetical protein
MVSATTWPEPAVEVLVSWQPPAELLVWSVLQVLEEAESPAGGPRAPVVELTPVGPSLPAASLRTLPAHPAEPA